ncbi:7480_t:CDS:2, partial [Scutellospora calospora]
THSDEIRLIASKMKHRGNQIYVELQEKLNNLQKSFYEEVQKFVDGDFPENLVQERRLELENFCRKKFLNYTQAQLEMSANKFKYRLPMKGDYLEFEWSAVLEQSERMYLNLVNSFNDNSSPDELRTSASSHLESIKKINNDAWENKARTFCQHAVKEFESVIATNFPVNDKK